MTISLEIRENDVILITKYAESHNISVSELFRQAVMEKIEDEFDLQCYANAIESYKNDSKTYTLHEVESELAKPT